MVLKTLHRQPECLFFMNSLRQRFAVKRGKNLKSLLLRPQKTFRYQLANAPTRVLQQVSAKQACIMSTPPETTPLAKQEAETWTCRRLGRWGSLRITVCRERCLSPSVIKSSKLLIRAIIGRTRDWIDKWTSKRSPLPHGTKSHYSAERLLKAKAPSGAGAWTKSWTCFFSTTRLAGILFFNQSSYVHYDEAAFSVLKSRRLQTGNKKPLAFERFIVLHLHFGTVEVPVWLGAGN